MSAIPPASFAARLADLAARGQAHIRKVRQGRALGAALARLLPVLLVVPGTLVLIHLTQTLVGQPRTDFGGWTVLGATAAVAFAWMAYEHVRFAPPSVPREAGLALFDLDTDAADRLTTADAFLRRTDRTAFMDAAIEDAEAFLAPAEARTLTAPLVTGPAPFDVVRYVGAALLLCLFLGLAGQPGGTDAEDAQPDAPTVADVDVAAAPATHPAPPNPPTGTKTEARTPDAKAAPTDTGMAKPLTRAPADLKEDAKKTQGKTSAGQASDAESMSGANDARGAPSNQSPPSKKGNAKKTKPSKKPIKPKPENKDTKPTRNMDEQQSGSTSGRGSSKGSNKNPVGTNWKSKDQVEPDEEDDVADDEDVEDEESDQEARGGVQPNLRDRKPPVSRDLSIGFGNRPSPDANGRGGPSQQKKSRGTASLVLGVPIPDRVKGQPNPGKTKVTQERVEPRRETTPPLSAGARTPRATPIGRMAEPRFAPWLRDVIRSYFLRLRTGTQGDR